MNADKTAKIHYSKLLIASFVIALLCNKTTFTKSYENKTITPKINSTTFKITQDNNGKFWFVDPQGKKFLSIGINHVISQPDIIRPGTQYYDPVNTVFNASYKDWKQEVINLLIDTGFNTLGSWTGPRLQDKKIYETICVYTASHAQDRCLEALRPGFENRVRENIAIILAAYENFDNVIGFFLDNEMPWYGRSGWDIIPNYTLLEVALELPATDHANQAAKKFLKDKYKTLQAFSNAWGKELNSWDQLDYEFIKKCVNENTQKDRDDFTFLAADKFFAASCKVLREIFPGKLILGVRFGSIAPESVIRACGMHCDVISFNNYRRLPNANEYLLTRYWVYGQKPIMLTEYSWRSKDNTSGNPNTRGAGAVLETQTQRAANYQAFVEDLLSYPMVIGAHWFEFADQSPQGRADGEDSNYGIIDIRHRPYQKLIDAMKQTNKKINEIHAKSKRTAPTSMPKPPTVLFDPGQHPDRPPFVDLLAQTPIRNHEGFAANDAGIEFQKGPPALLHYNTGEQWGCGFIFFGPKTMTAKAGPDHTMDIDGYSAIEIDAEIPEGLLFEVFLDEAGVDEANNDIFDTSAGDDGESFYFDAISGKGKRNVYKFDLHNAKPRTAYGNQNGKRRIDTQAMKSIDLYFNGLQSTGTVKIYSIKLVK